MVDGLTNATNAAVVVPLILLVLILVLIGAFYYARNVWDEQTRHDRS